MATGDHSERLDDLLQSVADGEALDWSSLEREASSDEALRHLLAELKIVAGVAEVHRSVGLEHEPAPAGHGSGTTRPPGSPGGPGVGTSASPDGSSDRWGHFHLLRRIGEGAFGEVLEARDSWLDHVVALKLLKPHLENQSQLLHEARLLAKIRHENVVRVHGADVNDGRIGFWMEFVQGRTLAEVVSREGVLGAHEAVMYGQALCRALSAVHANGIAHRDIKAKNVMRETGGRVVLMDFGAGEAMRGETTGPRTGTPLYLAPELFESRPATPQSDIYALGVLLFYLVTDQYPVVAASIEELMLAHVRGDRRRLRDLRPDLPDSFVHVVEQMLAADPARRYATAGTALEALEDVLLPAPPPVPPPVPVPVPAPKPGPKALRIAGGVAIGLASIMLVGLLTSASFNIAFGRQAGFGSESPLQWFRWGLSLLLSPVVRIGLAVAVLAMVLAAGRVAGRLIKPLGAAGDRCRTAVAAFRQRNGIDDPTLTLQVVTGVGALAFVLLGVLLREQTTAFAVFVNDASLEELFWLQPGHAALFNRCGRMLELGLFLYGTAAYAVYRNARRSGTAPQRGAVMVAVLVPILALILLRVLPYRIVYQSEFERVDLAKERCYETGARGEELLLYCPDVKPPRNRIVQRSDTRLDRRGFIENAWAPLAESQAIR